jgi:hypothetical protein
MADPRSKEKNLFSRCASQRFVEAQILLKADQSTGAVYLAGYGIECILKALILSAVPSSRLDSMLASFRGHRAHDYEWLRQQYSENNGPGFPRDLNEQFTLVNNWSTALRYVPGQIDLADAEDFLKAAKVIIEFAKGRL